MADVAATPPSNRRIRDLNLNARDLWDLEEANCSKTPSTELYIPPSQRHGNSPSATSKNVQRLLFAESLCPVALEGLGAPSGGPILEKSPRKQGRNEVQNANLTSDRSPKKAKKMKGDLRIATDDEALGLAVAASDGTVLGSCVLAQDLVPCSVIEAALLVRRARQRNGLDDLLFEAQEYTSGNDEDWTLLLDSSAMHEAYLDVGLSV